MTVNNICNLINNLFSSVRKPAKDFPTALVSIGGQMKPGLSTMVSVSNIVTEISKHGIPTGAMPDGSENKNVVLIRAIVDEVYRALREDANVQAAYAPGAINVISMGANSGGPVVSQGINTNFGKGQAIIQ